MALPPLYDPILVQPMRDELTAVGVQELTTPEAVDQAMAQPGTTLVFVNSVCGCAAGSARPRMVERPEPRHPIRRVHGQGKERMSPEAIRALVARIGAGQVKLRARKSVVANSATRSG